MLKSKLKNDPVTTYEYLFKDEKFLQDLIRHIGDASIAGIARFLLNDNLEAIQDGLAGPEK